MKKTSILLGLLALPLLFSCGEKPIEDTSTSPESSVKETTGELPLGAITHDLSIGRKMTLGYPKDRKVTFLSSDPSVAKVSQTGVVTALSEGSCLIQAKDQDNNVGEVSIQVHALPTDLKGIFSLAKNYNFTIPYSSASYFYLDPYNVVRGNSLSSIGSGSLVPLSGILQNGEQGLASFTLKNGSVDIEGFYGLGKVKTALDVYGDPFSPFFASVSDWKASSLTNKTNFTTQKEDLIEDFASLMGMQTYVTYINEVKLTVDYQKMSLYYSAILSNEEYGFYINDIGLTSSSKVESYVALPSKMEARNEWNEEDKAKIQANFELDKLPFLTGSGYSLSLSSYDKKLSISDYTSGDLTDSYTKQLTDAGWTDHGKEDSHMGYEEETLSYSLPKKNKYDGETEYKVTIRYLPNDILAPKDQKAFPNGKFEAVFVSITTPYSNTSANEDNLNAYLEEKGLGKFPKLSLNGLASEVTFEDVLEANNESVKTGIEMGLLTEEDYYTFACYVTLSIEKEGDARNILTSYIGLLETAGLTYSEQYSNIQSDYYVYLKDRLEVGMRIAKNDDKSYAKKLTIFFGF